MITAHLPAAYLTGRVMARSGPVLWAAIIGGVFPDLDLFWFFLVDNRAIHHHHYWVHIPFFWALIAAIMLPMLRVANSAWLGTAAAFFVGIAVHLALDTIAGDIKWLWPLSDNFFHLVTIPALYSNWILNFVLHPVFLLEVLIWIAAIWTLWRRTVDDHIQER